MKVALLTCLTLLLAGCVSTPPVEVETDRGTTYQLVRSGQSYMADLHGVVPDIHQAIIRGLRDLRIRPILHNDAASALYEGKFADGEAFSVRIEQIQPRVVQMRIRVGMLADLPRAEYLFRQFEVHFPKDRFQVGPDGN